ncbi:hypothetical protein LOTGIDRAFT_239407 [Lottia gigantea]|uniref:Protein kinase domain-containing protein n=1 Tax=Lottia gigantea TaxID=225164 RepID=V4C2X8_LOTGI|nr:hypothetical protein LOTGIDRAFT_239407 [Lottia gigantea]ESO95844.1 hypothetical protein LOTGIDRAFT_239407 [Lottia gigantea]
MGAENSILSDCEWGEKFPVTANSDWSLQQATTQNGLNITVFQHKRKDRKEVDLLKKAAKYLKTIRHPSILRFIASGESSEGSYLVTEEVFPLESIIKNLSAIEICAGIYEILEALVFLHDKVGISHNNICLSSIYVLKDGSWKLGGLEHCCLFKEATVQFLEKCRAFRNEDSVSPEEKAGKSDTSESHGYVRDVYSFGMLIDQLLEYLDPLGKIKDNFEKRIHTECLNIEASQRPNLNSLLNDPLFKNDFIDIIKFLKNITVKSEDEKKEFFSSLTSKLLALPEPLISRRLTSLLLSRFILLDNQANKFLLPHLLTPSNNNERSSSIKAGKITPVLSRVVYKDHVIPLITNIFYVRETNIRLTLLKYFSVYVELFDMEVLENEIFPHLLLGVRDNDDKIVSASLHGLADIVPLLGGEVVIGKSRKQFFTPGLPKVNNKIIADEMKIKSRSVSDVFDKKILLKDIAGGKNGEISVEEEKKRKMAERERRREMARIKREERKLKHQEETKAVKQNGTVHLPIADSQEPMEPSSTDLPMNGHMTTHDIELIESEERATDWPEWENAEHNLEINDDLEPWNNDPDLDKSESESIVSESAISEEIENQLLSMPTTIEDSPPQRSKPSLDASCDIDNNCPSVTTSLKESDSKNLKKSPRSNSNSTSIPLKKSPLQLKTKGDKAITRSKVQSSKTEISVVKETHEEISYLNKDWGMASLDSITSSHVTVTDQSTLVVNKTDQSQPTGDSRRSSTSTGSSNSRKLPKTTHNLGEEFEIKSIKVKPVSDSFDFFADMAPEIKTDDKLSKLLETPSPSASVSGSTSTNVSGLSSPLTSAFQDKDTDHSKTTKSSDKFSLNQISTSEDVDENTGTGDGWGEDDLDWGNEF